MERFFLLVLIIAQCAANSQTIQVRNEFKKFFTEAKVRGSFSLYDLKNDKYILVNKQQFAQGFSPASTFKICNSLIGIETGVIADENFVIPWDGVKRTREIWNADQDLKTAYKNSTVPYYQELARRVGSERMNFWLKKAEYGNADASGGVDMFWLNGGLRVTPEQQLQFLRRLHNETLPFSQRTISIVKKIMIEEETEAYTLRAKTGMNEWRNQTVGWYVGYVTTNENTYFFATCVQSAKSNANFAMNRKVITRKILQELKILPAS